MPEQPTVAIIAHHPQAVYFGMKSGFLPEEPAPTRSSPAAIAAQARRRTKYRPDLLTHREHAAMMGACAGDEEDRCRL
jgi:hypothetical protein